MANSKSLQSYTEISSLKASRDNVQNVIFYPRVSLCGYDPSNIRASIIQAFSDADFRPHVYYVSGIRVQGQCGYPKLIFPASSPLFCFEARHDLCLRGSNTNSKKDFMYLTKEYTPIKLHPSSQLPHLIIIGSIPLRISSIYLSFAPNARRFYMVIHVLFES